MFHHIENIANGLNRWLCAALGENTADGLYRSLCRALGEKIANGLNRWLCAALGENTARGLYRLLCQNNLDFKSSSSLALQHKFRAANVLNVSSHRKHSQRFKPLAMPCIGRKYSPRIMPLAMPK